MVRRVRGRDREDGTKTRGRGWNRIVRRGRGWNRIARRGRGDKETRTGSRGGGKRTRTSSQGHDREDGTKARGRDRKSLNSLVIGSCDFTPVGATAIITARPVV